MLSGCQVDDDFAGFRQCQGKAGVEQRSYFDAHARLLQPLEACGFHRGCCAPGCYQIVAERGENLRQLAADKARGAGYDNAHG